MTKLTLSEPEVGFIQHLVDTKNSVTIFLGNGVKLTGKIANFGEQGLLLERDGRVQLVWHHAVSTICLYADSR